MPRADPIILPGPAKIEPLPPSNELREMRQFAGKMMTFWTVIFPAAFMSQHIIKSLQTGSWVLTGVFGTMWLLIGAFCWQIRQAFKVLMATQDLHDEVGHAELIVRKERARRTANRLASAQDRLARIHEQQEMAARDEVVDDLVVLHEELGSDQPPGVPIHRT